MTGPVRIPGVSRAHVVVSRLRVGVSRPQVATTVIFATATLYTDQPEAEH
jgi:hypothetical protein